jgi:acetoacetyl-CoA synthetase
MSDSAAQNGSTSANHENHPEKLWESSNPQDTELFKFMMHINQVYGKDFKTYDELYQWSIEEIGLFWGAVWSYTNVVGKQFTKVD